MTGPAPAHPCDSAEKRHRRPLEDAGDPVTGQATLGDELTTLCDVPGRQLPPSPSLAHERDGTDLKQG